MYRCTDEKLSEGMNLCVWQAVSAQMSFGFFAEQEEALRCVQKGREGERMRGSKPEREQSNKETMVEENMLRKETGRESWTRTTKKKNAKQCWLDPIYVYCRFCLWNWRPSIPVFDVRTWNDICVSLNLLLGHVYIHLSSLCHLLFVYHVLPAAHLLISPLIPCTALLKQQFSFFLLQFSAVLRNMVLFFEKEKN